MPAHIPDAIDPAGAQGSIVLVEYPKRLAHLIRDTIGPLVKFKDRKYGRTLVAMYGPADMLG